MNASMSLGDDAGGAALAEVVAEATPFAGPAPTFFEPAAPTFAAAGVVAAPSFGGSAGVRTAAGGAVRGVDSIRAGTAPGRGAASDRAAPGAAAGRAWPATARGGRSPLDRDVTTATPPRISPARAATAPARARPGRRAGSAGAPLDDSESVVVHARTDTASALGAGGGPRT